MKEKQLSVVLGTYNRKEYLKKTILTLRSEIDQFKLDAEIIVVDGGSDDGTLEWLVKQKDIIVIVQHNRGVWRGKRIERRSWGYFMNLAFKSAQGKYVCMLSDDCLVVPGAISNGITRFETKLKEDATLGALAFYWRNWPIDKDYYVGLTLGRRLFVNHGLYTRQALEAVSYIDERSFDFYHADGDLVLRMNERGYRCEDSPDSYIEHYADANTQVRATNLAKQKIDWAFYNERWAKLVSEASGYTGGWIYKTFHDSNETGRRHFRWIYLRDRFIRSYLKAWNKLMGK